MAATSTTKKNKPFAKSTTIRVSTKARDAFNQLAYQNRVPANELFDVMLTVFSGMTEAQQSAAIRRR